MTYMNSRKHDAGDAQEWNAACAVGPGAKTRLRTGRFRPLEAASAAGAPLADDSPFAPHNDMTPEIEAILFGE